MPEAKDLDLGSTEVYLKSRRYRSVIGWRAFWSALPLTTHNIGLTHN